MLLHAFDKARTLELAAACGVRIPPTRFPRTLAEARAAAEAIGYPCILKPRFSDFWDGGRFQAEHGARYVPDHAGLEAGVAACRRGEAWPLIQGIVAGRGKGDRKSTRLNSSHRCISYAVFCLKKKRNSTNVLPT